MLTVDLEGGAMPALTRDTISFAGFVLDSLRGELRDAAGQRVVLRPKAYALLRHLALEAPRLVGKDELMQVAWPGVVVTDDSLTQCVKDLRNALGDHQHRLIRTEPRRGYRLCCDAAESDDVDEVAAFRQEIRFATTADGVRIAYGISGSGGPPLVRASHWMTHLDWDWRTDPLGPRIRSFSRRFRFFRYDGRGHGLSDRDATPGTLDEKVFDLAAVVDAAGLKRFALLGSSGGATIAIRYAARFPERVGRLVLVGTVVRGAQRNGEAPEDHEAWCRLVASGWGKDNAAFRQLITSRLWPAADARQMAAFNHLQQVASTPEAAVLAMRRDWVMDVTAELAQVRCPTLILHSPCDAAVPFEFSREAAAAIPDARLVPFDSPNHTPLADEPAFEVVQQLIEDFVDDADAPQLWPPRSDAHSARPPLRAVGGSALDARTGS
jgi:pimeloyl-ACP methyl ester carboxylesterase/DNA-binding winged helix-turn-helix (wHTH) protein